MHDKVSAKWNAYQAAMTQCLTSTVKDIINAKVSEKLADDGLLGQSRLGILLDELATRVTRTVYVQLVQCANAMIDRGVAVVRPRQPTKKGKAIASAHQFSEGIFSKAKSLNSQQFRAQGKRKHK